MTWCYNMPVTRLCMLHANNNVQIGSTRSIVFSRNVSIDLQHCPECRIQRYNPRYFPSQFHINRAICKSCLLHQHVWVVLWVMLYLDIWSVLIWRVAQVEYMWWWAVYRHGHPDDNHDKPSCTVETTSFFQVRRIFQQCLHQWMHGIHVMPSLLQVHPKLVQSPQHPRP